MKFDNFKQDKGVAGLIILLSLITMLFVIGLLVMIFALMGGELMGSTSLSAQHSASTTDTGLTVTDGGTTLTTCNAGVAGTVTNVVEAWNETGTILIESGNYSVSTCTITALDVLFNDTVWNVTYTYTYAGAGYTVINDTTSGIASVTDWFPIFIVIGAMVVLILLTVIIITAIRSSGMMATGGNAGTLGSA